ncbi:MAG: collagen-like protein, partial [Chloroflexi bacterium]|nr:collagen-like protein [Chloroflexota bacterium]
MPITAVRTTAISARTRAFVESPPLVAAGCVLLLQLFGQIPVNGDLYLALPIARKVADPALYSAGDLIVTAGLRGPFHIYRLAGNLYRLPVDVDLLWHGLFLAFLWLFFLATWRLSHRLTRSPLAASLTLVLLATAPPFRGSLNWSWVPLPALVTALFAMPLAILAFASLFAGNWARASLLAGLTFNIHPYVGAITAACTVIAGAAFAETPRRKLLSVLAAATAAPSALYLLGNLGANLDSSLDAAFYAQFRTYAYHAFVEDHWRQGYAWFALMLAGVLFLIQRRHFSHERLPLVATVLLILLALPIAYGVNAYAIRSGFILQTFLFRSTYFLKPISFAILVAGLANWYYSHRHLTRRGRARALVALGCLAAGAVSPHVGLAEALALVGLTLVVIQHWRSRWSGIAVAGAILAGLVRTVPGAVAGVFGSSIGPVEDLSVGLVIIGAALLVVGMTWKKRVESPLVGLTSASGRSPDDPGGLPPVMLSHSESLADPSGSSPVMLSHSEASLGPELATPGRCFAAAQHDDERVGRCENTLASPPIDPAHAAGHPLAGEHPSPPAPLPRGGRGETGEAHSPPAPLPRGGRGETGVAPSPPAPLPRGGRGETGSAP